MDGIPSVLGRDGAIAGDIDRDGVRNIPKIIVAEVQSTLGVRGIEIIKIQGVRSGIVIEAAPGAIGGGEQATRRGIEHIALIALRVCFVKYNRASQIAIGEGVISILLVSTALAAAVVGGGAGKGSRCCQIAPLCYLLIIGVWFGICLYAIVNLDNIVYIIPGIYSGFLLAGELQSIGCGDIVILPGRDILVAGPCHIPPGVFSFVRLKGFQLDGAFIFKGERTAQIEGIALLPRIGVFNFSTGR